MTDDNRLHQASTLRAFFDEQVQHLHDLVGSHIHHEQQLDEDKQIVDGFVETANSKMRAVHGYAEKLREHVCALYHHVLQISEQIPPPVELNHEAFAANPLVNSLFVNTDDIDRLFQRNPEAEHYFRSHDKDHVPVVYALLTACKNEKSTLGVGLLGDMLVRDIPQQTVNFHAHKVHIPCANSDELAAALKHYLFAQVVTLIKQEMASRMMHPVSELDDNSYESRIKSLANPDVYLHTLLEYLKVPASLLSIDKAHYRLSKLGVKVDHDDGQCANEFDIDELTWSDGTRNVVLQIAYGR